MSACGKFRFYLERQWAPPNAEFTTLGVIMLNPSTADHEKEDPTSRAVIDFAKRWKFGRLLIGNLYAYRTPSADALRRAVLAGIAVQAENDTWLRNIINRSDQVMVGWGSWGRVYRERVRQVDHLIRHLNRVPRCIGITESGDPKHPLLRFHTRQQKAAAHLEPWVCP